MDIETIDDQGDAHEEEKRQDKDLDGGMPVHKFRNRK